MGCESELPARQQFNDRICATCGHMLPVDKSNVQSGFYCCDEHYCSEGCLDKSFEGTGYTWDEHYSDDGQCYYTAWEYDPKLEAVL